MSRSLGSDVRSILKGIQLVSREAWKLQGKECKEVWKNSSIQSAVNECSSGKSFPIQGTQNIEEKISKVASESIQRSQMVLEGLKALYSYSPGAPLPASNSNKPEAEATPNINFADTNATNAPKYEESFKPTKPIESTSLASIDINKTNPVAQEPIRAVTKEPEEVLRNNSQEIPIISEQVKSPKENITVKTRPKVKQVLSETAKQRAVPSTRISRLFSFGSLAAGLGVGTVAEASRRALGIGKSPSVGTTLDAAFLSEANAERIVNTLCKVRGAALKIGQILSIQDNSIISPQLQKAFERVRQSADFMPLWQVEKVMASELGSDWRSKVASFEPKPFAAASIGQVHLATLHDGTDVAMKIQYPGVAQGIESDIENLVSVMKVWNIFPEGLFIDNLVEVAKKELSWEVDYEREAVCTKKFKKLVEPYPEYIVPTVIDELCTKQIFTSQLIEGMPVDQCVSLDEATRKKIGLSIMKLCLKELFEFRYMQTDPNWSNFFYDPESQKLALLDFGATREYEKPFMDMYIQVIKSAADGDRDGVLKMSKAMGFLTGYESKVMEQAHVDTVMILGEVFQRDAPFDFGRQDTTKRVQNLVPTMINHRLCPPPEQIYSLHRKLSGVFLLCAKLKVAISCRPLFEEVWANYRFGELEPSLNVPT